MVDIRLHFETKIYEYAQANDLKVAGENWPASDQKSPHLSISMLYAKSFDVTLCGDAASGIFEVKYHGALGVGTEAADRAAQSIIDLFKSDRHVLAGGKPYRSPAFTTDDSYVVVVSIPYVVY